MKNQRQNLIMQIVKDENIGTQEELREALKRNGLKVTQATVFKGYKRAFPCKDHWFRRAIIKYSLPVHSKKDIAEQKQWYFRHNFRRRCVSGSCA